MWWEEQGLQLWLKNLEKMSNVMERNKEYIFVAQRGMSLCPEQVYGREETGRSLEISEEMLWGQFGMRAEENTEKGEEKREWEKE